jgi:outer membrane lipoprotein-sorting protein
MVQRRRGRAIAAILLVTLAVAGLGVTVVRADDDPELPAVSADELLASTIEAASRPVTISGPVSTTLDLGLPELPASLTTGVGLPSILTSLTGTQRWRVWHSPDGLRVAHLLVAREQDLVVNRDAAWWWDSADLRAIRLDLTAMRSATGGSSPTPSDTPFDPIELARTLIRGVAPCASVSVQGTTTVAGRDAYVLALTPLTDDSLLGSVRFAIDARTRLPLRVEVLPRGGGDPAITAGYTAVSFDPIDPAMFAFEPPPGATVRDASDMARQSSSPETGEAAGAGGLPSVSDSRVVGECAGVILAVRLDGPLPARAAQLLPFAGPVGSAMAVDRGDHTWVLAGLVDASALEARAAELP